jgi:hypothetical protein
MAALPTERSWCVLESARCNSFMAIKRALWRQFGSRGLTETSIRRRYEQFRYRGCISHQGKGGAGRPRVTEETVDTARKLSLAAPGNLCGEPVEIWRNRSPPLPKTQPELWEHINTAIGKVTQDMLERVWQEWGYRLDICLITLWVHIECI